MRVKKLKNYKLKTVTIFSAGIVVGISALLFGGAVMKNGFPQSSHADTTNNKNTIPFVCFSSCSPSSPGIVDPANPGFGNRFAGKDLTNAYINNLSSRGGIDYSNVILKNAYMIEIQTSGDNWTGADLTNAYAFGSTLGSDFTDANFTGANLSSSTLSGNFTNANFTNANLNGDTTWAARSLVQFGQILLARMELTAIMTEIPVLVMEFNPSIAS